ncbi:MAG: metalloregulator ArsR/SmtB family transcription factor [Chloroflexota bacterium]|nr:metalloregulator ArsR/SmtB family transcription factor [Chloroflexota bacterium]
MMKDEREYQEKDEHLLRFTPDQVDLLLRFGRALADQTRIRILGLLIERPMYGQELAEALAVKPPTISHHLTILKQAGLVLARRENAYHYYELDQDGIRQVAESLFAESLLPQIPRNDERARVLASFFKDGRLLNIPAQHKKRRYVLEELARAFEWGHIYEEKEVNAILQEFHEDASSLRRDLIAEKIMMRDRGRYWLVRPHSPAEGEA